VDILYPSLGIEVVREVLLQVRQHHGMDMDWRGREEGVT